jgi:hypothetical protein
MEYSQRNLQAQLKTAQANTEVISLMIVIFFPNRCY